MSHTCESLPWLLSAPQLAKGLGISVRGVWRLRRIGSLPAPVRVGRLVKWVRVEIERWISAGCPNCRKGGHYDTP